MTYQPGSTFAGYRIERVLGAGGMGTVYLVEHPRLPRRDALKLLRADLSADPGFRTRFEREADLAARLDHRNIVTVYDRGRTDDQLWIDMQFVPGTDAAQALFEEPDAMTPERVVRIVAEVGNGLDFAHRRGLWHRDVKPANILLAPSDGEEPERVLLTDFGVAKAVDEARQLTSTGNMLATLAYAAPEQIESRALDHRADVYALGCVLYELLTGGVPFPEATAYATMAAHLKKPPPRPSELVPSLSEAMDDVVARAMAKDRDERFSSCRELAVAARAALPDAAPAAADARSEETFTLSPRTPRPVAAPTTSGPVLRPAPAPEAAAAPTGLRPPFQIRVSRRDGKGGDWELGPVFTDGLSLIETGMLEDLLQRSNFFAMPARLPADRPGTGDMAQEITVFGEGRSHTVAYLLTGSRRPPELDQFVTQLERFAGWRRVGAAAVETPATPTPTPSPAPPRTVTPARVAPPAWSPPASAPVRPVAPAHLVGSAPVGSGPPGSGHTGPGGPGRPTGPGGAARPWWRRPAGVAAVAALLVAAVVATILVVSGGGPPATPADLEATSTTSGEVALAWDAVEGAARYRVDRDGDAIGTTTETTFVDDDVTSGEQYRYTVVALESGGEESAPSSGERVTVPQPLPPLDSPESLSLSSDMGVVTLTWAAVEEATSYEVFRGSTSLYTGAETTFVDDDPGLGTLQYAVRATAEDGRLSDRSPDMQITLAEEWGDAETIRAAFPSLLPAVPNRPGWDDATCGPGEAADDSFTDGTVLCDYPSGIHLEVLHYPDAAALQSRVDEIAADSASPTTWRYEATDAEPARDGGTLYVSPTDAAAPYRFATFVAEERALFAVYAIWPGHTAEELRADWWYPAPF